MLSWLEALSASGFRRACRMAISRNACPLLASRDDDHVGVESRGAVKTGPKFCKASGRSKLTREPKQIDAQLGKQTGAE